MDFKKELEKLKTIEEVFDLVDSFLENANYHELVGFGIKLWKDISPNISEEYKLSAAKLLALNIYKING
ncbi:gp191 [Bacillus phage G]|uniref:Gp191 n=1 Tax=Bacillus phage G TaxID=2884420 RepID=G3MBQ7_9CAUD|nr:gp191 [Bacillus phage G]AEO93451.1 gp191 [Bacillus phage G]